MIIHRHKDRMFIDVYGASKGGTIKAEAQSWVVSGTHTSGRQPTSSKRLIVRDKSKPVGVSPDGYFVDMGYGEHITVTIPGGVAGCVVRYYPGTTAIVWFNEDGGGWQMA